MCACVCGGGRGNDTRVRPRAPFPAPPPRAWPASTVLRGYASCRNALSLRGEGTLSETDANENNNKNETNVF